MKDDVRLSLRLPKELHDRLADKARRERRSLNNLIVVLLEQAGAE